MLGAMTRPALYGFPLSSATARVRIALELKGIDYEYRLVNLRAGEQYKDDYLKQVNPQGQVPALLIDDRRLCQSIAICEYLDETRPEPPLLPKDVAERARCRHYVELINSGIQPLQNLGVIRKVVELTGDKEQRGAWPTMWIERGFTALEALMDGNAGTYCMGDAITLADVVLAPQVRGARLYGVDVSKFPLISRIDAALSEIPAFVSGLRTEA